MSHKIKIGLICCKINFTCTVHLKCKCIQTVYMRKIFIILIWKFRFSHSLLCSYNFVTWSGIWILDPKDTSRSQSATENCTIFWNNLLFLRERALLTKCSENISLLWGKKLLIGLPHWNGVNRLWNIYEHYMCLFVLCM